VKSNTNRRLLFLAACIAFILFIAENSSAKPVNLLGSWKGFFQGQDDESVSDGLTQFRQIYNASWNPLITQKMYFTANMGYSNNWVENLGTRELISPSLRLSVKNDIFNWNLNGDYLENNISFREDVHTTSWNSNLSSSWNRYLWPTISLRMGQRFEERDDFDSGFSTRIGEDTTYSYIGSSLTWEVYKFKMYYDYNRSRRDRDYDRATSNEDEEGHLAKIEYNDSYWDNRVSLGFSQLFYDNQLDFSSGGTDSLVQVPVSSGLSGVDLTPSSGGLQLNQALIDGNRITPAVTIKLQEPVNIGLRTRFNSVDTLYVYTTRDDRLLVANPNAISWDLYTSNDGVNWQLVRANVPSSFNNVEFRFEITPGAVQADYVKLVVTGWLPALDVEITEFEAYTTLPAGSGGDYERNSRNYKTEVYLGVNPLEDVRFNYTFSWDQTENTGLNTSDVEQLIQSGRVDWAFSRYFNPSAGFSTILNKNDAPSAIDTESRTYDVQVRSAVLPTLDLTLTYSWNEYFEDDTRTRTVNYVGASALAALYPDLSAELTVGYNQNHNELTDEESEGEFINLVLYAWLRKSLNLTLQTSYNFADSAMIVVPGGHLGHGASVFQNTSSESGETSVIISWRPSDILSFALRGYTLYGDNVDSSYGGSFNANYQIFRSSKTNLTLGYILTYAQERETVNNFVVTWGWDISKHFSLNTSGNYVIADNDNSWNFYTQLTTKF